MKTADNKISAVIHLKHTVEQSEALRAALSMCNANNVLLNYYCTVSYMLSIKLYNET
jgi:hypothetical protein